VDVLFIIAPAFAVILTGFVAVRTKLLPESLADPLVTFAYIVCVPSLMFSIVARYPLEGLLGGDFWIAFGGGSVIALLILRFASGRLLGADGRTRTVSAMTAVMANTGFVSLPLLYAIFGDRGVPPAAIANIVIAAIMIPLAVLMLEATGGLKGSALSLRRQALQVLRNPMVWPALLGFGFAWAQIPVPDVAERYLDILGQGLTPCALFAIGASIRLTTLRLEATRIITITVLKLAVIPALVLGAGLLLQLDPFLLAAAVICAASPSANTAYVLAMQYRTQEEAVAAAISMSTLVAIITLPLWILFLAVLKPALFPA
jgi:malonate transporter and related proteins